MEKSRIILGCLGILITSSQPSFAYEISKVILDEGLQVVDLDDSTRCISLDPTKNGPSNFPHSYLKIYGRRDEDQYHLKIENYYTKTIARPNPYTPVTDQSVVNPDQLARLMKVVRKTGDDFPHKEKIIYGVFDAKRRVDIQAGETIRMSGSLIKAGSVVNLTAKKIKLKNMTFKTSQVVSLLPAETLQNIPAIQSLKWTNKTLNYTEDAQEFSPQISLVSPEHFNSPVTKVDFEKDQIDLSIWNSSFVQMCFN